MGAVVGLFVSQDNLDDEEQEQQELDRWRPSGDSHHAAAQKRKRSSSKSSESSDGGSQAGQSAGDSESIASSAKDLDGGSEASEDEKSAGEEEKKSEASKEDEEEGSSQGSDGDQDADALAKKSDQKRKKKIVVRMEFEPLLALHEPLAAPVMEPAEIFAHGKKKLRAGDKAALTDGLYDCIRRAKDVLTWMADNGYEECALRELADAVGEEPDELRYALEQSQRMMVDDDGMAKKTTLQKIFDGMNNEIEAVDEVLGRLDGITRDDIQEQAAASSGQLRIKVARGVDLLEHVDLEAEGRLQEEEERELRIRAREEKAKQKAKRKGKQQQEEEEEDDESSDDELAGESEKKALAFRRVQVQRKIEEFLKAYTKGQNLIKINAKGKRYHRRVYVDTAKRALVVQGASGPKFFPFASMKEVDIETRTSKEGRVETLVICAIEKGGRIIKELNLAFPDQAKANNFVNCVTLFSLALRQGGAKK